MFYFNSVIAHQSSDNNIVREKLGHMDTPLVSDVTMRQVQTLHTEIVLGKTTLNLWLKKTMPKFIVIFMVLNLLKIKYYHKIILFTSYIIISTITISYSKEIISISNTCINLKTIYVSYIVIKTISISNIMIETMSISYIIIYIKSI